MRLFFSCFLLLAGSQCFATNYYISLDGAPNTFAFEKTDSVLLLLQPGDTLFFHKGEYFLDNSIKPVNSGTRENWIVIRNFPGQRVIFNGARFQSDPETGRSLTRSRTGLITIRNVEYVDIIGLEVRNSHNIGIVVRDTTTRNIRIQHCRSHGSYNSGIALWYAVNCVIEYSEITGANDQELRTVERLRREAPHEALTIAGAKYFEVRFNHIHDCFKEGIDCKEVSSKGIIHHNLIHDMERQGLYLDSWFGLLHDVEVHSNIVFYCEWGLAISGEGRNSRMQNIWVHHNLLAENRASGLLFGVWGNDELRENINIFNNTISGNGSPSHWAGKTGGIDIRSGNLKDVLIINNILSGNWAFEIASFARPDTAAEALKRRNIAISNNLITRTKEIKEEKKLFNQVYAFTPDETIIANPGFENPGLMKYGLKENSPARGKGVRLKNLNSSADLGAGDELYIWFD